MSEVRDHHQWMQKAIELASHAEALGEVPIGALLVKNSEVVAEAFNQSIRLHDPTAHAEILCLREAGRVLNNYRLNETTLYVTLEPCPMCAAAMVHARVKTLVFGAYDPKTGAAGSIMNLVNHQRSNHQIEVIGGVNAQACSEQLSDFFKRRRQQQKYNKSNSAIG